MNNLELAKRAGALLGGVWVWRLSCGLGLNYSTTKRWAAGSHNIPDYVGVVLHLLEVTPRSRWPQSFRSFPEHRPPSGTFAYPPNPEHWKSVQRMLRRIKG